MAVLIAFAFLSGIITILSPCILPVLPIVLSGGAGGGKSRPFGVISGFVVSFSFFTLALSGIVQALNLSPDLLRYVAIALIVAFGVVMLVPKLSGMFETLVSRIASGPQRPGTAKRSGFWGGVPVGLSLGLVWTPCVGPIMASVISLALTSRIDGGSVAITVAYSLGTAIPMLAIMLGGRALIAKVPALAKNGGRIQRGFGVVMILMGLTLAMQWDRQIQAAVLKAFPAYGSGLTALEDLAPVKQALEARAGGPGSTPVGVAGPPGAPSNSPPPGGPAIFAGAPDGPGGVADWGLAPEFVAQGPWLSGAPSAGQGSAAPPAAAPALTLASLRGKVVLVDFWTYSCVNCIRTLPELKALEDGYGDKGLVIVGVHTPEFAFEKDSANVSRAMRDLGVGWTVVQDNDYSEWNAWGNRYWPAHYLIDARGHVRYWHFGEGGHMETEAVVRQLLAEAGAAVTSIAAAAPEASLAARTPETYLGYARGKGFASAVSPIADKPVDYRPSRSPANGEWNLEGRWTISSWYVQPEGGGALELGFDARDVYLVAEPEGGGGSIAVSVDGAAAPDTADLKRGILRPDASRLYHIVGLKTGGAHRLRLELKGGIRLYSFTFG